MREAILSLLRCAEQLFSRVLEDVEPYSKPDRIGHMLLFRRFTDSQQEYCRSILILYEADCFQGTIPVLRALVEVSVAQILLHQDNDSTLWDVLKSDERVRIAEALKTIGWPCDQGDIYAQLSKMTHPCRTSAFLGRTLDFASEPLKSLVTRKDLAGMAGIILSQGGRESEEAQQERWVFVALNTFDVAMSSLLTLYGADSPEKHWWSLQCLSQFELLAEHYPHIKQNLLWFRLPWQHSKVSQMEKLAVEILSKETDTDE
jgi:hypothetical protein